MNFGFVVKFPPKPSHELLTDLVKYIVMAGLCVVAQTALACLVVAIHGRSFYQVDNCTNLECCGGYCGGGCSSCSTCNEPCSKCKTCCDSSCDCLPSCASLAAPLNTTVPNVLIISDSIGGEGTGYLTNVQAMLGPSSSNVTGGGFIGNAEVQAGPGLS